MTTLSIHFFYFSIQERIWLILLQLNWNIDQTLQAQIIKKFIHTARFFVGGIIDAANAT